MKALTLWQPWASLVARGHKKIETRCWSTKYRGELAIHSAAQRPAKWLGSSRFTKEFEFELREVLGIDGVCDPSYQVERSVNMMPRGTVLCIVKLVDIVPTSQLRDEISQRERVFDNYEDGRYAWFIELLETFETKPIPAKGNRMLWNWER